MIKENLALIQKNIEEACKRSGRQSSDITLIAVSKTQPVPMLQEVYSTGIIEFGENKVQEFLQKEEVLSKDIHWHIIGHLQTNKVKYIVDKVHLIHSVDSLHLGEQIQKEAKKSNVICNILIEVNIARETSKYGVLVEDIEPLLHELSKLSHIRVQGLMTIAPFVDDAEKNRDHFRNLRQLMIDIKTKNIDNVTMNILSMGMTGDYEVAIEEGATMIRVGTGIFGERNYI